MVDRKKLAAMNTLAEKRSFLLGEYDFEEEKKEVLSGTIGPTGFPDPHKSYRLTWEVYDLSLEEPYFWVLDSLKGGFTHIDKLEDSFAAAENSAFFGLTQQRLGGQQDKVSQFLAQIGKMIKELFQMVRELRILDERLGYYNSVEKELKKPIDKRQRPSEVTLKGFFVDLVQGGGKSPASVYGMASQLEFVTLPDLFFDAPPFKSEEEVANHIKNLEKDFNRNVLRVLTRHLHQFSQWRARTHQEHKQRKIFMTKYLHQHYDIIQMYINWLKPYLRNVQKLNMKGLNMQSADIVSAFEGSMLDVEILARIKSKDIKVKDQKVEEGWHCVLVTFNYRTRPELKVVQEGYQRGPVHIGKLELNIRAYHWVKEDIENYKKLKNDETFELIGNISGTVRESMEALGDELKHYLEDKPGEEEEEEKEEEKPSFAQRFFGDFYTPKKKKKDESPNAAAAEAAIKKFREPGGSPAMFYAFLIYNTFKKAHRMITW